MRYIQGVNRNQTLLLPETLDEYVPPESPVRVIDAFVDGLDFEALGFTYAPPKDLGRKPYNPADMLKLYIYGYLNKIRSSRRLETEACRNVEVI